jgi:DNA-binding GntR family transcriptional regulator
MERLVMDELTNRITPAEIARLEAHVQAEEQAQARSDAESIRLAGEFHLILAELTGNALLNRYVNELASRCSLILAIYGRPHSSECAVNEHRSLIAALRRGDRDQCRQLMDEHLDAVMGRALLTPQPARDFRDVLAVYADTEGLEPKRTRGDPRP